MTALLLTVAGLLVVALATALVARWARREPPFADTQDDPRQADAMRCPWPEAD